MKTEDPITSKQITAIRTTLYKRELLPYKEEIILQFTEGRTELVRAMTRQEAWQLMQWLYRDSSEYNSKLMSKLFAMAFELGWIKEESIVSPSTGGGQGEVKITRKKNYQPLHDWVLKFGYLKKELRKYTHNELTKLVTQFEQGPYTHYLKNKNN